MPTVTLTREDGKLAGATDKDKRAYAKWHDRIKTMGPRDSLVFSWKEPRSGPHHRLFFSKVSALLDIQEQFDDPDTLRRWLTVGAGYCDLVPGPNGKAVALPQSIAYEKLDEVEFRELHRKIDDFLRSPHATFFLWPHLTPAQQSEMVDVFLRGFEKE